MILVFSNYRASLSVVVVSSILPSPEGAIKLRNKLSEIALFSLISDCNALARLSKL
jgi:hypothetical protein